MFATSLLFIVGCSNGKIEISDIENSLAGEYSCQVKLWALPGSELFLYTYKTGDRNFTRTTYGIAYEVIQNQIYSLKGGSNFFGKIPIIKKMSSMRDDDILFQSRKAKKEAGVNDNSVMLACCYLGRMTEKEFKLYNKI